MGYRLVSWRCTRDRAETRDTNCHDRDIKSRKATPMKMFTNSFCAAGLSMPNGSFAVFGGNAPVGPDGNTPKCVLLRQSARVHF